MNDLKYVVINIIFFLLMSFGCVMSMENGQPLASLMQQREDQKLREQRCQDQQDKSTMKEISQELRHQWVRDFMKPSNPLIQEKIHQACQENLNQTLTGDFLVERPVKDVNPVVHGFLSNDIDRITQIRKMQALLAVPPLPARILMFQDLCDQYSQKFRNIVDLKDRSAKKIILDDLFDATFSLVPNASFRNERWNIAFDELTKTYNQYLDILAAQEQAQELSEQASMMQEDILTQKEIYYSAMVIRMLNILDSLSILKMRGVSYDFKKQMVKDHLKEFDNHGFKNYLPSFFNHSLKKLKEAQGALSQEVSLIRKAYKLWLDLLDIKLSLLVE